jgi:PAS domain S-box-containing protein
MPSRPAATTRSITPADLFARVLLAIFLIELAVMTFLYPAIARLGAVSASLIDAAILVAASAPLLWYSITRPLAAGKTAGGTTPHVLPRSDFLQLLAVIFLTEFLVMLVLPDFLPGADTVTRSLADAGLTTMVCAPILWYLRFQQLPVGRTDSRVELLATPLKLYVLLLALIFVTDMLDMVSLGHLALPLGNGLFHKFADSFITTLFAAPFLWFLVVRPLRSAALTEKTLLDAVRGQVVDAIVTINDAGFIESVNPAAEKIFGYDADELAGLPATLLFGNDRQCLADLFRAAAASESGKTTHMSHEICVGRRFGTPLTMDVSVSRIELHGRVRLVVIMRDITDRKQTEKALKESEERFRQLYAQTDDAIFLIHPGSCAVIDANPAAEKLYGYTAEELQRGGLSMLCKAGEFPRVRDFATLTTGDETVHLDHVVNTAKDGAELIVSLRRKTIVLRNQEVVYCTVRDITELVRLEELTRDFQARMIQTNKMASLGLLVSGVAHEINNPNSFILANSQLLTKSWAAAIPKLREYCQEHGDFRIDGMTFLQLCDESPEMFEGITEGARRIREIVSSLKEFAQQNRSVVVRPVDINRVVTASASLVRHLIHGYTDNFRLILAQEPPIASGNFQKLEQVVINLLLNACQALPDRQHGVRVTTGHDQTADQVTITVVDEGSGIPPEIRSRILEPFFTTKLDSGGTGLGLAIAQSIVKELHGSLEFTSEPAKGTTFTIRLPASTAAVALERG